MHNPDLSREKSLYHLLLTVVRRMNAPISPHKKEISDALKLLTITKSDGAYHVVIDGLEKQRHTSVPVSDLKFYDTKNDATIAEKNLKAANRIALELFPELGAKGDLHKKSKKSNYIDLLFVFYSLSLMLYYTFDLQVLLGIPAAIAFAFIPFWNLSSNLNPKVRWLSSLTFMFLSFTLFYSPSSGSWVEINLAIMLSLFLLNYSRRGHFRPIALPILVALFVLMVFFEDHQIAFLAVVFVALEKFIELLFRISKKLGLVAFAFFFISTIALMITELIILNNPFLTVSLGAIMFGYFLFIYGVGTSWGGFLRTILPSLGVLSLEGLNVLIYLSISLVLFRCFKLISNQVDKKLGAI
jgi:hypothetical protein